LVLAMNHFISLLDSPRMDDPQLKNLGEFLTADEIDWPHICLPECDYYDPVWDYDELSPDEWPIRFANLDTDLQFEILTSTRSREISQAKIAAQQELGAKRLQKHRRQNLTYEKRSKERDRLSEYRKQNPDYVRKDNVRRLRAIAKSRVIKPFAGTDGEGATARTPFGTVLAHRYVMFRAGDEKLVDDGGLRWEEMLEFLCNLPREKQHVSFFFDYDVTMILKSYPDWSALAGRKNPETGLREGGLIQRGSTILRGPNSRYWQVWYVPRGHFAVRPVKWSREDSRSVPVLDEARGHNVRISDTSKFFHRKFVKVVNDYEAGTPEIREKIAIGKDKRSVLAHFDSEMDEYNRLECVSLAEVMEKLRSAWKSTGYRNPTWWEGPGWLTAVMFSENDVPKAEEYENKIPVEVHQASVGAYFGGIMMACMFGPVPGNGKTPVNSKPRFGKNTKNLPYPVNWYVPHFRCLPTDLVVEADINSAYPYAMLDLPCIRHSKWRHTKNRPGKLALMKIAATYPKGWDRQNLGPKDPWVFCLPHRNREGRVSFPPETTGWYWSIEVRQALHNRIEVLDSWTWEPSNCGCDPFSFIKRMFELRLELEKEHKNRGVPLKLAMNSAYGKLAQAVGKAPYRSYIMAGFITSHCRTRIASMVHSQGCLNHTDGKPDPQLPCGANVVAIATDAVWHLGDPGWEESSDLGGLKTKRHENGLFSVQSGMYYSDHLPEPKTRGVPVNLFLKYEQDIRDSYKEFIWKWPHACRVLTNNGPGGSTPRQCGLPRNHEGNHEWIPAITGHVIIPWQKFMGLRETVHRNLSPLERLRRNSQAGMGEFYNENRIIGFNWDVKRDPIWWFACSSRFPDETLWTVPLPVANVESVPYEHKSPNWYGAIHGLDPSNPDDAQAIIDYINDTPEYMPTLQSPEIDADDFSDAMRWHPNEGTEN
jgi:hypothetical protein